MQHVHYHVYVNDVCSYNSADLLLSFTILVDNRFQSTQPHQYHACPQNFSVSLVGFFFGYYTKIDRQNSYPATYTSHSLLHHKSSQYPFYNISLALQPTNTYNELTPESKLQTFFLR